MSYSIKETKEFAELVVAVIKAWQSAVDNDGKFSPTDLTDLNFFISAFFQKGAAAFDGIRGMLPELGDVDQSEGAELALLFDEAFRIKNNPALEIACQDTFARALAFAISIDQLVSLIAEQRKAQAEGTLEEGA